MQVLERSAIVPHTAAQMFALVDEVGRYPEFLPWCVGARIQVLSDTERLAGISVARGMFRSEFTTRNTVVGDSLIRMHLVDGPFRALTGEWHFDSIGEHGSRVRFRVEFEFKNRLAAAALGSTFESLCGTIVEAFAQRARTIYG